MTKTKTLMLMGTALMALPTSALAQDETGNGDATTRMALDRLIISAGTEKSQSIRPRP